MSHPLKFKHVLLQKYVLISILNFQNIKINVWFMHLLDIIEIGQICYIYFYIWEKRPWPWNVSDFFPSTLFALIGKNAIMPIHRLTPNLGKSWSRVIGCNNARIVMKCVRLLDGAAADVPVKFQSDRKSLNPHLATSSLHEIVRFSRLVNNYGRFVAVR